MTMQPRLPFTFLLCASLALYGCDMTGLNMVFEDTGNGIDTLSMVDDRIDTLHYIKYASIKGVSVEEKYAWAAAISSLQGLMNRFPNNDASYIQMSNEMDWSADFATRCTFVRQWGKDFRGMVDELIRHAGTKDYVLMDDFGSEDDDLNLTIATSYASAFQGFILTTSLASNPVFDGCTCVADTRDKDMNDVFKMLKDGKFRTDGVVSVNKKPNHNVDLAIRHRWACIKSNDEDFTDRFFSRIDPLSVRISYNGPTTNEGFNVRCSSRHDLYVTAGGLCCNMSTHERIGSFSTDLSVNTRRYAVDYERTDVHRVMILVSDGGNLEYFENKFPKCYKSEHYGEFPLSFMMSPMLKRFKPIVQDWYMHNMSPDCCVITSLSGAGDIYPSWMTSDESRRAYGQLTDSLMRKEGQTITAIMDRNDRIDNDWDKVVGYSAPIVRELKGCRGVIFLGYGFILDGKCTYIGDTPMVACRFSCIYRSGEIMDTDDNPKSQRNVATAVKSLPKDANSPDGYSIILFNANPPGNVTPKPDIMDDVTTLVNYLNEDPGIEIVNAYQFFDLYNYHLHDKVKHIQ